uniref:UDP-glucuronosyltransferase n=1 Tax=Parastrongyloides trichosuri TaxID=131310 RepID=A0A0N4ZKG0_PARTI
MFSSKSHSYSIYPLAKELTLLGNNVTLFNYGVKTIAKFKDINVKEILFNDSEIYDAHIEMYGRLAWNKNDPKIMKLLPMMVYRYGKYLSNNSDYHDLLNTKWDGVIINEALIGQAAVSAIYMKEKNNIPIISLSTTDYSFCQASFRGLERYSLIEGSMYFGGEEKYKPKNFYYKFKTFLGNIKEYNLFVNNLSSLYQILADFINIEISLEKFYSYSSWNIVETFDRVFLPAPISSSTTFSGSSCDDIKKETLKDKKLEDFINDNNSNGTIYMAFGSQMSWNWAPLHVVENFMKVFERLENYKVIWSINIDLVNITIPSNVLLVSWAQQTAILNHSKTKVFITHGGLKSFKESICGGVPMLSIPFYVDQTKNSLNGEILGILERVDRFNLTTNNIYNKLFKVLKDNNYKRNVIKIRNFISDRIMNPTKESAYFTNKIIKIKHKYPYQREFWKIRGSKVFFTSRYFCDTIFLLLFLFIFISF